MSSKYRAVLVWLSAIASNPQHKAGATKVRPKDGWMDGARNIKKETLTAINC